MSLLRKCRHRKESSKRKDNRIPQPRIGINMKRKRIYKYDKNNSYGGHAVLITGWTKKYWIVQNSWGEKWGKKGRFYIPINKTGEVFFEVYGITDDIKAVKKVSKKIKTVSPIVNSVANIVKRVKRFYE